MITKYHNIATEHLLALAESKGGHSALITELARRLSDIIPVRTDVQTAHECPVCEAALQIEYDEENNLYNLKVEK